MVLGSWPIGLSRYSLASGLAPQGNCEPSIQVGGYSHIGAIRTNPAQIGTNDLAVRIQPSKLYRPDACPCPNVDGMLRIREWSKMYPAVPQALVNFMLEILPVLLLTTVGHRVCYCSGISVAQLNPPDLAVTCAGGNWCVSWCSLR
jgi:hypothetical protein